MPPARLLAVALGLSAAACGDDDPGLPPLPADFLFGAATAGFQVEMGCPTVPASECDDPNSDWYQFVTSEVTVGAPETFLAGNRPDASAGHWELYEHDLDLLVGELHGGGFRFSIEWSRIFPTSTVGVDDEGELAALADPVAVAHYHAVLAAARARGITPLVTLNHYTLPVWIHDAVGCFQDLATCSPRGWLDADVTVREIAKYAGFVAREFGGEVDLWATLNEPLAIVLPGYIMPTSDRTNPPARSFQLAEARTVLTALIEAHARMYDAAIAGDRRDADGDGVEAEIGVVFNMTPVRPADPDNATDVAGAANVFYLYNMAFLNAAAKGELDADLDGVAEPRADLAGRMDYLGINYYTRITVQGSSAAALPDLSPLSTFNPVTVQPWEDYPRGIYEMAMRVKDDFGLPMFIAENGVADPDDDGTGPSFLTRHLSWLSLAIADGADVRGYFYWTLMDNYEWNHGMGIRMGLFAIDPADPAKARVPRATVATYRSIIDAGRVPDELQRAYPIERDLP